MASTHKVQEQRFAAVEPGLPQFTPPGSRASVIFGAAAMRAAPGSVQDVMLTVDDLPAGTA